MKLLIAPDKFKHSLSGKEVAAAIDKGLKRYDPHITTLLNPLADGGEGTLDCLGTAMELETIEILVKDPLFRPVKAIYLADEANAYIEMARASGLELLASEERNCLLTTSFGTGQLILDAINRGKKTIYLFVGGSATNDAGIGAANALGYRFLDKEGKEVSPIGKHLVDIHTIDKSGLVNNLEQIDVNVVCDVTNEFYGKNGAAYVYARQKGADDVGIALLDRGLRNIAGIIENQLGISVATIPGAGAAGGIGGGAIAFLNAKVLPGIDTILDVFNFEEKLSTCDAIITGEGKMDGQTLHGKVIYGVCKLARKYNIPVYAICGMIELSEKDFKTLGIRKALAVKTPDISVETAIREAGKRVEDLAFELMARE